LTASTLRPSDGRGRAAARATLLALLVALAAACSRDVDTITACEEHDGLVPICGFSNPEDLVLVAGTPWIIVSEFPHEGGVGALVAFRTVDGKLRRIYPDGPDEGLLGSPAPMAGWGAPDCPGPPDPAKFAPHGIDTRRDAFGAGVLAVVNHGGRQAVELFEIGYAAGGPAVGWRGCVPLPDDVWPNDVAFWPGGGFAVTNMMPPREGARGLLAGIELALGWKTGDVLRWTPEGGLRPIEGSAGSAPNGVAVSADGSEVFVAEWGGRRLVRLRLDGEPRRSEVALSFRPDNLSWSREGRLLVAGQAAGLGEILACGNLEEGTCAIDYVVISVEPESLETRVLLKQRATVTGAVSSALNAGGELYLGTFAGDRIVRLRYPR